MITKEEFLKGLKIIRERENFVDTLNKLKINIIETSDQFDELLTLYVHSILTDEGVDWYTWYLYEKPQTEEVHAWEADGTPIPMSTDEDLWNFISSNNYLR